MDGSGLRMQLQKFLIFRNGPRQIARLLFLHSVLHQLLGARLRLRCDWKDWSEGKGESKKKEGLLHTQQLFCYQNKYTGTSEAP